MMLHKNTFKWRPVRKAHSIPSKWKQSESGNSITSPQT